MVAPHETGDLVRSLVRVAGSGRDRSLAPMLIDLSNVSSLAATVQISSQLPTELLQPSLQRQQQLLGVNSERTSENECPGKSKHPRNSSVKRLAVVLIKDQPPQKAQEGLGNHTMSREASGSDGVEPPPPKKVRLENKTQQQQQWVPRPTLLQSARVVIVPQHFVQQQQQQQSRSTLTAAHVLTSVSDQERINERDALLRENAALQKKLSLFQQLFRDKKRLASLMQHLGVKCSKPLSTL